MSEETQNDGTWSGIKKTIIGVIGTVVTAGGVWLSTLLGGGDKETTPAAAPVINITNSNQQSQQSTGGKTIIIKEKTVEAKPVVPVKKKEGDEFKEKPAQW
jgi:hypothetical protein